MTHETVPHPLFQPDPSEQESGGLPHTSVVSTIRPHSPGVRWAPYKSTLHRHRRDKGTVTPYVSVEATTVGSTRPPFAFTTSTESGFRECGVEMTTIGNGARDESGFTPPSDTLPIRSRDRRGRVWTEYGVGVPVTGREEKLESGLR